MTTKENRSDRPSGEIVCTDGGIAVGTFDDLKGSRERRGIDRNPSIDCHECGNSHKYQNYWEGRYVDGYDWNPAEIYWLCDDCLDEMYAWYERRAAERNHRTLTEWSA